MIYFTAPDPRRLLVCGISSTMSRAWNPSFKAWDPQCELDHNWQNQIAKENGHRVPDIWILMKGLPLL